MAFQTSTTNGTTGIYALPNGTSTAASWQATNAADPTNASKILIATNGSTDVQLVSGVNGTGTYLPLAFYNNGLGRFVIGTAGQFGIGPTASVSYGTSGQAFISGGASAAPSWGTLGPAGGGTGITTTPANGALLIGNGTNYTSATLNPGTAIGVTNASGSITINNTGVTSAVAGTGISVSGATGAVTITNSGVTSAVAGTGVSVSGSTGAVTFNIGQAVATSSTPTFASLTLGSGTTGQTLQAYTGGSYAAIYSTNITPSTTNYTLAHNGSGTNLNGVTSVALNVSGSVISSITSAGLAVTGAITATGNITAYFSDDRLKTRLGSIENALDKVSALNGFYYEANETAQKLGYEAKREVGVSAQDVQAVLPEIVAPAPIDNQYLTIHYERIVPLLIEAIKELRAEVADLRSKI